MEPDVDPEARIRDLERPLADRARASELGTQPYASSAGVPVPPPPPSPSAGYPAGGSPYYAPPQHVVRKNSHATALWLIPLSAGVVIVTAVIVGIIFVTSGSPSLPAPVAPPGIAGGGGSIDVPVIPEVPAFPAIPENPFGAGEEIVTVGPGAVTSLGGVDTTRTVMCDGGTVSISGVRNVVDVQGACSTVVVSGLENVLTVDTAETIRASGLNNRVTYRNGAPEVSRSGSGNIVEQG
ncbi:DUF3060 domain-containing protein [Mycobacterium sp. SMC-4]|uniref:DUF3060 domain-containing protein n=1 Tax=Mycobacterium sp. SMC-4 TaxID=2857059 RepID=UPI0021B39DEA|nr:DUF3060 domain-containing protein [Mycobacterium sp. SMC-4]UXA18865.1 DUF3060 domain-containing protein [Mycobacterium sp. SMC-4]